MKNNEKYSDVEIIERLRNRDNEVVNYIYRRYSSMIRLMIYDLGGSVEDAKDVFQEGMIALTVLFDDPEYKLECRLKTLFYSICKNQWKSQLSKISAAKNYFLRKIDDNGNHDFTENYDSDICKKIFWATFDELEKDCKTILKLVWRDHNMKEIADIVGNSYGYVRRKKCDCNNKLIDKIKGHPTIKCMIRAEETALY
jgi:RNA polymerase sigma factor (sigma-70 family)